MQNQEMDWNMYKYLLEDALTRLRSTVGVFRQVEDGTLPFTYAIAARRSLTIIGDELSRYSTIDVKPPVEGITQ